MGSVIKRNNLDGPPDAKSGSRPTSRRHRPRTADMIQEDSLAEEDEKDGWQSVGNVVVDEDGDEGVSRPFNIAVSLPRCYSTEN